MHKRTWAQIDLDALRHNYRIADRLGSRVMPVIKANAYGHGVVACARALMDEGADCFAVACLSEAITLRDHGILGDILILGYTSPEEFSDVVDRDIVQTVMCVEYAQQLADYAKGQGGCARVHIKLDTGMARLGLLGRSKEDVEGCAEQVCRICGMSGLRVEGIYTHFAMADVPNTAFTERQMAMFTAIVWRAESMGAVLPIKHCANSGAIINHPEFKWDMVREGIMLYGEKPDLSCPDIGLMPVMSVKSVVAACSVLRKGEPIGYGGTYVAQEDMRVAVIPIGYADGYRRELSNRGWVSINGCHCPIVGRVCMDQLMVNIRECPKVEVGDEVCVIGGDGPSMAELAQLCQTISYELLCGISPRVPRVYMSNGKIIKM